MDENLNSKEERSNLPSQYDIYDRIEEKQLTSLHPKPKWNCVQTTSMNPESTMFRYHPPERFIPSTPPISHNNHKPSVSNMGDNVPVDATTEWNGERKTDLVSRTRESPVLIDCSSPQIRLLWRHDQKHSTESSIASSSPLSSDLPAPVHVRQRSAPTTMPSFERYQLNKDITLGDSGLEQNTVSSSSITKEATGTLGSDTYNLVIDIHVHGAEYQTDNDRMTRSLSIQPEVALPPKYITQSHEMKGLVDKTFIGDSLESMTQRNALDWTTERSKRNSSLARKHGMNCKIGLTETKRKLSSLGSTQAGTSDNYSEVSQTQRGDKNWAGKYRIETPIPQRKQTNQELTKTWKSGKPSRSSSVCIQRDLPDLTSSSDTQNQPYMDVLQVVRLLQSPEPEVVINASAYLQHLVYRNPNMKERTRQCGGIAALVQLLYSEHVQICQNTVGVLRNITSGDNLEIKEELERVGGIRALSWLIENRQGYFRPIPHSTESTTLTDELTVSTEPTHTTAAATTEALVNDEFRPTLDSAAAVLCNLAAVNHLKRSVLHEAVLPSLVHTVLKPAACQTVSNDSGAIVREPSFITVLFRNVAAVLRNVSSSEDHDVRDRMRQCPYLLWSLITILRAAVRLQCFDTKSVEHCVCCLRNLCFSLQHATTMHNETTLARKSESCAETKSLSGSMKLFRMKSSSMKAKFHIEKEKSPELSEPFPPKSALKLLYQTGTIQMLVDLLQSSSNPCTLEAAAGTIQNLTAGGLLTGPIVRKTVRNLQSLPVLVELINAPARRVATAAANALRNLALEEESCLLLGKHALVRILAALSDCATSLLSQTVTERHSNGAEWMIPSSTRSGSLLRLSQTMSPAQTQSVYSARSVAAALLSLCCVLVHQKLQHARRFVTLGGVETCQDILCNTNDACSRHSTDRATDHTSTERVNQLAHQLLQILWSFVELRPIYKLAGWNETDFGIIKRGHRLGSLVRKRSKTLRHSTSKKPLLVQSNKHGAEIFQTNGRICSLNDQFSSLELHEDYSDMSPIGSSRQSNTYPNGYYCNDQPCTRTLWNDSFRPRAVYIPASEPNTERTDWSDKTLGALTVKAIEVQTNGAHQQSYDSSQTNRIC